MLLKQPIQFLSLSRYPLHYPHILMLQVAGKKCTTEKVGKADFQGLSVLDENKHLLPLQIIQASGINTHHTMS